jgi:hypothetical protein
MSTITWYPIYILGAGVLACLGTLITAILYQYFTFNSCPPGTRPLPSPKGRLPLLGHRHLINPVKPPPISLTQTNLRESFINWSNELGEVYQLQMGNFKFIVLSSDVAVKVYHLNPLSRIRKSWIAIPQ